MCNSLEAYRAAIGTSHLTTHRLISLSVSKFNIRYSIYCVVSIWCLLGLKCFVENDKFALYRVLLLLMCMDVHLNPGPSPIETETSVNSLDVLHLNTRTIRNKSDYIENIAESFHILCFSETHLDASVTANNLLLDGLDEPFRKDRSHNGGGYYGLRVQCIKVQTKN